MISIFFLFNLQLLRAAGRGEVQGEDEEGYMKREGMIWGIEQGAHCNIPNMNPLFFFYIYITLVKRLSKRKNNAVTHCHAQGW